MRYLTIKELEKMLIASRTDDQPGPQITSAWIENKWVVAQLDNGIRIKFRNF